MTIERLQHRATSANTVSSTPPTPRRAASTSQGSSSESEDEGGPDSPRQVSRSSSGANDRSSDEEESEDEDMGWMSDAESVGSDEVAKLHSEAGDWVGHDMEVDDEVRIFSHFLELLLGVVVWALSGQGKVRI